MENGESILHKSKKTVPDLNRSRSAKKIKKVSSPGGDASKKIDPDKQSPNINTVKVKGGSNTNNINVNNVDPSMSKSPSVKTSLKK